MDLLGQLQALADGRVTATGLVEHALTKIESEDRQTRAFVAVFADEARTEAKAADRRRAQGNPQPPLLGVPLAVKTDLRVAGHPHPMSGHRYPEPEDSVEVARLRHAGAIVLGQTAMSEGALWANTSSCLFGVTRNPAYPSLSPGGSSGGSAAAVSAGYVSAAVGTDMGGSVRIPAACCGLTGYKPEQGQDVDDPACLRWFGLRAVGPLAWTVQDCALLHDVLSGGYSRSAKLECLDACRTEPPPSRIGFARPNACPDDVQRALDTATVALAEFGHAVQPCAEPGRLSTHAATPRYLRAAADEILGLGSKALLQRRTQQAARAGRLVPRWVADAAVRLAPNLERDVHRAFLMHDLLLTPTLAGHVPGLGDLPEHSAVQATLRQRRLARHTIAWNVTDHPAIALPVPHPPEQQEKPEPQPPPSLQLIGRRGQQGHLLAVARQLQEHLRS